MHPSLQKVSEQSGDTGGLPFSGDVGYGTHTPSEMPGQSSAESRYSTAGGLQPAPARRPQSGFSAGTPAEGNLYEP